MTHDIDSAGWDSVLPGWVIWCVCGFCTAPSKLMESAGASYDDHLRNVGILKEG